MRSAHNLLLAAAGASSGGGGGGGSYTLNATFTGADNPSAVPNADTGQAWTTASGTWGIISNRLYCSTNTGDNHGYYDSGVSDGTITATLAIVNTSPTTALCFRYQDESNHWAFNVGGGNNWSIYQRSGGSYTSIISNTGVVAANGDQLKVVLSGTTVTAYINGVLFWTGTNSFLSTATKVGFRATGLGDRWDNLQVV